METAHSRLAELVAAELPGASAHGSEVIIEDVDLTIDCRVESPLRVDTLELASMTFEVTQPKLLPSPIPMRFRGVASDSPNRLEAAGNYWAQTSGRALIDAIEGENPDEVATVIGRSHNSYVSAFDRVFDMPQSNAERVTQKLRAHFGANPWLTSTVVSSGVLPPSLDHGYVLTVAMLVTTSGARIEVCVNGGRWRPAEAIFDDDVRLTKGAVLLSETAVLIPNTPPIDLSIPVLEHTLRGIWTSAHAPEFAAGWPGWEAHAGTLKPLAAPHTIERIEATVGKLPEDYRWFITRVAESGAGPGYGLMPPASKEGSISLADAGCGREWQLRLDRGRRGEVWLRTSTWGSTAGEGEDFVSPRFIDWYREWLQSAIAQRGPWMQWDTRFCSPTTVMQRRVRELTEQTGQTITNLRPYMEPGSLALTSGDGDLIRPCHGCTVLATHLGLDNSVFELPDTP